MSTILVVNDPKLVGDLRHSFAGRADCEVLTVDSGDVALERARQVKPDLIILDPAMPDTSGLEVCERLRADADLRQTPIVFISQEPAFLQCMEAGADAWVKKPVGREDLLEAILDYLPVTERGAPRRASALKVDYYREEGEGTSYTKDLGAGGLFLKSRDPFEDGEPLQLIFDLPSEDRPTIRAEGLVVRRVTADPDARQVAGVGVSFRKLSERDRLEIVRFVEADAAP